MRAVPYNSSSAFFKAKSLPLFAVRSGEHLWTEGDASDDALLNHHHAPPPRLSSLSLLDILQNTLHRYQSNASVSLRLTPLRLLLNTMYQSLPGFALVEGSKAIACVIIIRPLFVTYALHIIVSRHQYLPLLLHRNS